MLNLLPETKIWLATSIFAATAAFAQPSKSKNCVPAAPEQGHEMSKSQLMPIYRAPARIDVKSSWDVYVAGKFIYWQAREENLEIGLITRNDPEGIIIGDGPFTTTYVNNMNVVDPHFTFRPGFKVGIGANFDYDNWDAYAEYTWFHSTIKTGISPLAKDTATALPPNGEYLIPIQGAAGSMYFPGTGYFFFQDANQSWNLKMDFVDISLARSCYWGTKLALRPFFGARGAFLRQHLNTVMAGNTQYKSDTGLGYDTAVLHDSSVSWAVGPRAGFESNWLLGMGTRLIGNGSADILYTRYSLQTNEQLTNEAPPSHYNTGGAPIATNASVSQEVDYLRTHAELELGFGWGTYCDNNKWHIDLAATYGFQVFWDQNMFRNFSSTVMQGKSFAPDGNLYIHGMTLSASLDF
jgi:hypothetical protein